MRYWSVLVLAVCLLMSGCSLLFNPGENPSSDAASPPSDASSAGCGVFTALADDYQRYLRQDPLEPEQIWTISEDNPPLITGDAVNLTATQGSVSSLKARVSNVGNGSITIVLGPQFSKTLLFFSLGGAQFHRLEGSRGVYFYDGTTTPIDPGGTPYKHVSGNNTLRVTLSTELTGEKLVVSYSIAGSDGEDPVTFESVELTAGPMDLGILARWHTQDPNNNDTIVLESLSCP